METTKPAATVAQPDAARTTLFRNVYLWMTMALTLTALTAYSVAGSQTLLQAIFSSKFIFYGLLIGEIVLVLVLVANIMRMSFLTATLAFIAYSVLNGATLSVIFLIYDLGSIGTTFLVTAGMFGAMSLYGYVTGRDLSSWGNLLIILPIVLVCGFYLEKLAIDVNMLSSGDDVASNLGVDVRKLRNRGLILSTLISSICIAFTGTIGFIGLMAPHLCRMVIGNDSRYLFPASAVLGALILMVSDIVARVIMRPSELPVGIIMYVIGGIFFIWLVFGKKARTGEE